MKKDYRELYEKITNSDWFKKAYHNKSLGECPIVVEELEESGDERIRKEIYNFLIDMECKGEWITYFEKQKDASKAIEAVERIDKYISEHTANAHDMDNSNPNKKYYSGVDDTLSDISGILIDCYTNLGTFEVDAKFDAREPRDNWEYIKEFCDKFGRIPKDMDELDVLVSYVMDEKQKEQKPAEQNMREQIISKAKTEKQVVLISESNDRAEINWDTRSLEDTKALLEWGLTFINKQLGIESSESIPQSKQEWSEEDETRLKVIGEELERYIMFKQYGTPLSVDDLDWFKNLPERFNPQPKQEWSEEDERKLQKCIRIVEKWEEDFDIEDARYSSIFKSLRPQPKQELSIEKAIQWFEDTFFFQNNSSGRGEDYEITTYDFDSMEEMFESFRKSVIVESQPCWKPSKEQIEALERASTNEYLSAKQFDILVSLCEQLQKL